MDLPTLGRPIRRTIPDFMVLFYQMEDKEVIKRIKTGQIDYFVYIVRKYQPKLYRFFSQKVSEKDEVDDLVQETLIKFYKNIHRFKEDRPILPYLSVIAKNEIKMYWQKNSQKLLPLDERIGVNSKSFEEEINFDFLPINKKEKKIIDLLRQGYRYAEIGKILKLNENTIKTIIRRFRLKVKKIKDEKK